MYFHIAIRFQAILPDLAPLLGAVAIASLVVLISNSFPKSGKILVQIVLFGAALAGGLSYLIVNQDPQLVAAWELFVKLTVETRFSLSLVLVGVVYFGGAMYLASPDDSDGKEFIPSEANPVALSVYDTPASVDNETTFKVPLSLSSDDKIFFEEYLDV